MNTRKTYALVGRFETPEALLAGVVALRQAGVRHLNAYSPMPVEGLTEALELPPSRLPAMVLAGGLGGALLGGGFQYWSSVVHYSHVVSGRPYFAWPSFVPVTFELAILCAALTAVFGLLLRNGLPRLHHPIFEVPGFLRSSTDGFFIAVESTDARFDPLRTRQILEAAGAHDIVQISDADGVVA